MSAVREAAAPRRQGLFSGSARWWVFAVAVLVLPPWLLPEFHVTLLNYIGMATLVALGLVVMTGVAGIVSFGQQAFVGIAAYATAALTVLAGGSPWLGLAASLALVAVCAALIGWVTLRLSGHYLSIATIAWGIAIYHLFGNLPQLGQYSGIDNVPPVSLAGWAFDSGRKSYLLIWACTLAALVAANNLLDSRPGRAIRALRFRSAMAESCGVDTAALKQVVFVQAALLAGLAGWLHAHFLRFVSPARLRRQCRHRLPVHGGHRRRQPCLGRAGRRGHHDGGQGMAQGRAAPVVPARRQLRDHRVRRAHDPAAAAHPRGPGAGAGALVAGAAAGRAAARGHAAAAAPRAPGARHAAAGSEGPAKALRRAAGGQGAVVRHAFRRDPGPDRAQRRRQEHGVQPDQRHPARRAPARSACWASASTAIPRATSRGAAWRAASST